MHRIAQTLAAACLTITAACPAAAQSYHTEFGMEFVTVGDVGNSAYEEQGILGPSELADGRGSVDYEFRISRTEVVARDWADFLLALGPLAGNPISVSFTGGGFIGGVNAFGEYVVVPDTGTFETAAQVTPFQALRYANWLHNGKRSDSLDDFQNGAYDIESAIINDNGQVVIERQPGARVWVPNLDEWMKASFYDPNKNGEGEGGWWLYPNQSDEPPIPGAPEDGGTTNIGVIPLGLDLDLLNPGSYPDAMSAYGLLDVSGTMRETTEDGFLFGAAGQQGVVGGLFGTELIENLRFLDAGTTRTIGIRLAMPIPSISTMPLLIAGLLTIPRRRADC